MEYYTLYDDKKEWYVTGYLFNWYLYGCTHRENDLPAIEYFNGDKEWYYHGKLHRGGDLPAVITKNYYSWYKNGKLHRIGKPAVIWTDQTLPDEYWENGIRILEPECKIYNNEWYVNYVELELKNIPTVEEKIVKLKHLKIKSKYNNGIGLRNKRKFARIQRMVL